MTSEQIVPLQVDHVVEPKAHRRIDTKALEELTESVATHGILSPILVRPVNGRHELVFGQRRLLAARAAGLQEIPAMVREMTDAQVLEAQIIENCQREDIHPMEEAESYRTLHETYGYHVEEIAAKVGKSKAYVYGRLKLCALTEDAKQAFLDNELTASTALLVARIPVPELQDQAAKEITHPPFQDEPFSYREAFNYIQQNFMLRLHDAPFPKADAELVADAGPCTTCPNRTGNQPELFSDVKSADVCTNPKCYQAKLDAHWARLKVEAKEKGHRVLSDKEAKKTFQGSWLVYNSGLVDLMDRCPDDPKQRNYQTVLRKTELEKVYARDRNGNIRELAAEKDVRKALKTVGLEPRSSSTRSATPAVSAREKRAAERRKLTKQVARRAMEAIVEAAGKKKPDTPFWRLLVVLTEPAVHSEPTKAVMERRGIKMPASYYPDARCTTLIQGLKNLTEARARSLIVELLLEERLEYFVESYPAQLTEAARYYRIDLKKLEASVKSEADEKKGTPKRGRKVRHKTLKKKAAARKRGNA